MSMFKKTAAVLLSFIMLLPICGFASLADNENKAPTVIPAVREWVPGSGTLTITQGVRLCLDGNVQISDGKQNIIKDYLTDILGITADFTTDAPKAGDIVFTASDDDGIGAEGYTINTTDRIAISALTDTGFLYGMITVLQSHYADGYMPKGFVRDYPMYSVRSGMIDVARAYIPLEYVEEITKYYAWFKLNEIHLHINDSGANDYHIFRLESDIPGLTATDGFYSKEDYRNYQKRMLEYGVEVITEIDTPAHSACFKDIVPEYMLSDGRHIDITNPEAVQFVLDLFDEYITGDDPVFVSKRVHFGTDEYVSGYNEEMRAYTDTLIKHIRSRGYIPRFWGAFGNEGFNGATPVSTDAEANFWAVNLSDYKTLFSMGYDIINTCGSILYVVPGGNYGCPDYLNIESLYRSWFINYMGNDESTSVAYDNPQLKGACFALWNDRHTEYGGFSMFDIFDRVRGQVCLISEKTWTGEDTRNLSAADFIERYEQLSRRAGNTNPSRYYDLPLTEKDLGSIKSVGFPYIASIDLKLDSLDEKKVLLTGAEGEAYISADGKLNLTREGYRFTYDYRIPVGEEVNIKLYADNHKTVLIVNDTFFYEPKNTKNPALNESSTFVLPFERTLAEEEIKSIEVNTATYNIRDLEYSSNYALYRNVTVSALEVDWGILNEPLAVDGDPSTRLSFSRFEDEQWCIVDLGTERKVNKVVIDFFERIPEYEIYTSLDGENYTKVYHVSGLGEGIRETDTIEFETVSARYVKYVQLKRYYHKDYYTYYSGGICELEIYGSEDESYSLLLARADEIINDPDRDKDRAAAVRTAANTLRNYMESSKVYEPHLKGLYSLLEAQLESYYSADESGISEAESIPEQSGKPLSEKLWLYIPVAVLAAGLIGVTLFALLRPKKK